MKIQLIYPNMPLQFSLPHSIAQLSACAKENGDEVQLFDTTMYKGNKKTDEEKRVARGQIKPYTPRGVKSTDKYKDLNKQINKFGPDTIMITFVDNTYSIGMDILKSINKKIFTVAGGVSVILNNERFQNDMIDVAWDKTINDFFFPDDTNKMLKDDWTIFDDERLYRPMSGRYYKTIPILTDYGCPYTCGFCCAPSLRKKIKFMKKPIEFVIEELEFQIDRHDPEFIYFSSETFFSRAKGEIKKFSKIYNKFRLPFWCQTHVNTINEDRVKLLRDMNCHRIALGIESGNEKYRSDTISKHFKNSRAVKAFELLNKYEILAASNNVIGFPLETEDMIKDTIDLNKDIYKVMPGVQLNCYIYQPYHGTSLRDYCIRNGLLRDEQPNTVLGDPVINNPYIDDDKLMWIRDNFYGIVTGECDYESYQS